jgi:hypothetical protein
MFFQRLTLYIHLFNNKKADKNAMRNSLLIDTLIVMFSLLSGPVIIAQRVTLLSSS